MTAAAASVNVPLVIAVSDRRGQIVAVFSKDGAPATALANYNVPQPADEVAAALARTAAFFSNDQAPIGSRTVRFLSGIHFPPGVMNSESAPLYGIENTNRGCGFNTTYLPGQSLPVPTLLHSASPGLGILTGKADLLDSDYTAVNPAAFRSSRTAASPAGLALLPRPRPRTTTQSSNTPRLPELVAQRIRAGRAVSRGGRGRRRHAAVRQPDDDSRRRCRRNGHRHVYDRPVAGSGAAPEGDLIAEHGSTLGGLTLAQVQQIVANAIATGAATRAAIRLPPGSRARFVIAVADLDGSLLALYRMPDATMFSVDVAVAKSRNVVYFSGTPNAGRPSRCSCRTPPSLTGRLGSQRSLCIPKASTDTPPGPFYPLFTNDVAHPCTQGSQPANANQDGIVFFPGSTPLYVNGKLVGGLGVSGDGVDQDDYAAAGGAAGFEAPTAIRADQITIRGVRLTYQKFPANPTD